MLRNAQTRFRIGESSSVRTKSKVKVVRVLQEAEAADSVRPGLRVCPYLEQNEIYNVLSMPKEHRLRRKHPKFTLIRTSLPPKLVPMTRVSLTKDAFIGPYLGVVILQQDIRRVRFGNLFDPVTVRPPARRPMLRVSLRAPLGEMVSAVAYWTAELFGH